MCGIAFVYNSGIAKPELESRMQCCLKSLVHRGPDDSGIHGQGHWVAGHRRLSIIDVANSQQPMRDPSGNFTLVYNGEIYNFRELRRELEHNWNFVTQGDTEVVLAGLCVYGVKFLQKMHGMWAIAFWNNQEKQLLLTRDRIGKKPLYYYEKNDQFACSSEIPSLIHLTPQQLQEDLDSTADYLRYGFYLPGTTAYQQIKEVLPGHYLIWQVGNKSLQSCYWKLNTTNTPNSKNQAVDQLRSTFNSAIKRRMVADVEVGAFLSGGIDSSLIVACMVRKQDIKPKTFTIGFENSSFDERSFASRVAKQCNTHHYERVLQGFNTDQLLKLILDHHGQPFGDSSLLPTALVSQLAAEHVKVVLSGDGGDELFSGYQRYQAKVIFNLYIKVPAFIRKIIEKSVEKLPDPAKHHSRSIIKKAKLFINSVAVNKDQQTYVAPNTYSIDSFFQLAPELASRGHTAPSLPECKNEDDVMSMMMMDTFVYLPQDILAKVDRASMAFSLEARTPFLDTELIELAFNLPRTWHRSGFSGKKLLKLAFGDILPNIIWQRRKQGFAVPLTDWFRNHLGDQLISLLNSYKDTQLPVSKDTVQHLLTQHKLSKKDNSMALWTIFVYLMWKNSLR